MSTKKKSLKMPTTILTRRRKRHLTISSSHFYSQTSISAVTNKKELLCTRVIQLFNWHIISVRNTIQMKRLRRSYRSFQSNRWPEYSPKLMKKSIIPKKKRRRKKKRDKLDKGWMMMVSKTTVLNTKIKKTMIINTKSSNNMTMDTGIIDQRGLISDN